MDRNCQIVSQMLCLDGIFSWCSPGFLGTCFCFQLSFNQFLDICFMLQLYNVKSPGDGFITIYSCFGWPWNDRSEIDKFFCRECFDNHVICHIIYTMYLMLCHIHMLLSFKREPIWLVGFERGMFVQWVLLLCQQKPSGASTKAPWQRFQMGTGHPKNDMVNLLTIAQNCGLPGLKLKILIPSCANMVGFLPQGWVKIDENRPSWLPACFVQASSKHSKRSRFWLNTCISRNWIRLAFDHTC